MSARIKDVNGFWLVRDNPITKVGVFPYSGAQLGLKGPDADRIFQILRPEEELSKPEVLASFNLIPIIDGHKMLGDGHTDAEKYGVGGSTGDSSRYENGTVYNDLKIYSRGLAKKIESGVTELSCGYRCRYDLTPGTWQGQPYDGVQRFQTGNHLALVPEGRMGSSVAVLDAMIFTTPEQEPDQAMDYQAKLLAALEALITIVKAGPEATPEVPAPPPADDETPAPEPAPAPPAKVEDEPEVPAPAPAKDEDEEPAPATLDEALKVIAGLKGKIAAGNHAAMDEAALVRRLGARDALAGRLSKVVGVFDHRAMTEAEVAVYGVKKLGLKVAAGTELAALDGYLQARAAKPAPSTSALDGAPKAPSSLRNKVAQRGK